MMAFLCRQGVVSGLGLIFDLDGVIVDSNSIHSQTWRVYLRRFGIEVAGDFDQMMFGRRNDEIVREVFGVEATPAEIFRHGAAKEALYRDVMRPVLREHLVPGLVEFLERHREVPMGVATNAEPANVDFVLGAGGLRKYFRVIVHGDDVVRPKPDPEIYLSAAEKLGIPPVNCVVFEDSLTGTEAARAAGTRVVALQTTHRELPNVALSIRDFLDVELDTWLSSQRPVG